MTHLTLPKAHSANLDAARSGVATATSRLNLPVATPGKSYQRYRHPVVTAAHIPVEWRYDLDAETNPFGLERLGVNSVYNAGAILHDDRFLLVCRVEGDDRKSFFAVAESESGIDRFRFWDTPVVLPETDRPDVNVYDMRLTRHEDGCVYGVFCTERRDPAAPEHATNAAEAQCGIARTKDFVSWERLPDLVTPSPQQRNVVLHPDFVDGKYAFYTRPQDGFIDTGKGGGIGWGLADTMDGAVITEERVIEPRRFHTVYELKNGQGPPPLKTPAGWLHLAHGVRHNASGLRYVLYLFVTSLDDPSLVTHRPSGHFMAAGGDERIGDLHNVLFTNGWVERDGLVYIYYASCDTRMHVATAPLDQLLDYALRTPEDPYRTAACVRQRLELIGRNKRHGTA